MIFYREQHSSIFLNICRLHNIVSTNEVVLNVVFLKGAEKTTTSQASILKFLLKGQRAQPRLGEGFAHGPPALLPVPHRLQHRSELIREGKASRGIWGFRILGDQVEFGFPAATDVIELLNALVDQGRRSLLVGHGHPATEEHLKLLGKRVIKLRRAVELLLAGNLPSLANGADDLRHLPRKGVLLGTRSSQCSHEAHTRHEYTSSLHSALPDLPPACARS